METRNKQTDQSLTTNLIEQTSRFGSVSKSMPVLRSRAGRWNLSQALGIIKMEATISVLSLDSGFKLLYDPCSPGVPKWNCPAADKYMYKVYWWHLIKSLGYNDPGKISWEGKNKKSPKPQNDSIAIWRISAPEEPKFSDHHTYIPSKNTLTY